MRVDDASTGPSGADRLIWAATIRTFPSRQGGTVELFNFWDGGCRMGRIGAGSWSTIRSGCSNWDNRKRDLPLHAKRGRPPPGK